MQTTNRSGSWVRGGVAALLAMGVLVGVGTAAEAAPQTLLVCAPGGPGSTADAKERLDAFFRAFEAKTGMPIQGEYHTTQAGCDAFAAASKPTLAIFPYSHYFARRAADKLLPVAQVIRKGQGQNRYFLVAKKGATLESLAGKKLMSSHLADAEFLSKAAFDSKVDLRAGFEGQEVSTAIKAIKALARDKADVILLDENEHTSLADLALSADFAIVAESEPLPGAPLVVVGGDEALAGTLRAALAGLCDADAKACNALEVEGLRAADPATYEPLARKLGK